MNQVAEARNDRKGALAASVGLSLLFMAVYGSANAWASTRGPLGAIAFSWERHIPFLPWMILPYMSIDLFFVGGPFVCVRLEERRILTRRVVSAILAAGACFFLWPMTYAFPRPVPTGWTAPIYAFLHGFDAPHNLFPSLHIALRTLLVPVYVRRVRGLARFLVHTWFSLIGFSTIFTHQHHVADIAAGFALAGFCFYLFPDQRPAEELEPNPRVGLYYAVGAVLLGGLALMKFPGHAFLAWPAAALAVMARAYFRGGPAVFRKSGGRLPFSARCFLAPVLLGQWLSWVYYRRRASAWNEVTEDLWIGARLTDGEAREAIDRGVTAVLDLTGEFARPGPFKDLAYRNIPVLDLTAPTANQLTEALSFIEAERPRGRVLVHCKIGYSRSAAVVGAWLLASGRVRDAEGAVARLRRVRPGIVVRPEARRVLERFKDRTSGGLG